MSTAPNYVPGRSFADDEANNVAGRSLVKTDGLDSELADISASINSLNANQQALQRDDGKLQDSTVEPYALAEQTRALIAVAGCNPRGVWAPNTDYFYKEVIQRNNIAQICLQAHNSGSIFTQSFWLPISGDGTSAANAAAAAASATAAAGSASAASTNATNAATSASAASTSATAASTAATNAINSASSAATSENNAENSAIEAEANAAAAAASAASITAPKNSTSDPTFSSNSSVDAVSAEWVNGKFAGIIFDWPGDTAPPGAYALPIVPTNANRTGTFARVFAKHGTKWGSGDGVTTFGLPYCRANHAILSANGNVGSETSGQIPSHDHPITGRNATGSLGVVLTGTAIASGNNTTTGSAGSGTENLAAGMRMLRCIWL